jgi:hypothetical protein
VKAQEPRHSPKLQTALASENNSAKHAYPAKVRKCDNDLKALRTVQRMKAAISFQRDGAKRVNIDHLKVELQYRP